MLGKAVRKRRRDDDVQALVQQTLLGEAWENAAVAVAVFSDDGRYIACNRAMCTLTGYSREEILRMRVGVDLAVEPSENTALFEAIVSERQTAGRGGLRRKDGSETVVGFWAVETTAAGLPYFVTLYWEPGAGPSL
jgi:PAS domain S-box-containing protein